MPHLTAVVTVMTVVLYFVITLRVARARRKFGVALPRMTGSEDFERVVRVQANTLEWMPMFLPLLWLCAFYAGDRIAAAIGLVWIAGRVMYMLGYSSAVASRLPGFITQAFACIGLLIATVVAMASQFMR